MGLSLAYIVIGVISFIIYVKWRQSYWKRKGVPSSDADFLLGDNTKIFTNKESLGEISVERYKKFKPQGLKHAGFYNFLQPVYFPIDIDIIKHIMQQDANYFASHATYSNPDDVLSKHLFALEGERWKDLRAKLTPAFTSGKLKMMFETITHKTVGLEKAVATMVDKKEAFVLKEFLCNFTTDVIASCGFGIESDCLGDPNDAFRRAGKKIFEPRPFRFAILSLFSWDLLPKLGYKHFSNELTNFFTNVVTSTIKHREENQIFGKDFMHLLLQLKNQGVLTDDDKVIGSGKEKGILSESDIIAQCFVFFIAGFETSSSTMTFAMLELAQHPDIQDKLRNEILEVLAKHDGKITYEAVMEMPYLEKVICEALRKFPPLPIIPRRCTKTYKVPGTDLVLERGTDVQTPVWAIQNDPEYYENPEVFDPERFSEENKKGRPEYAYLPFGAGPRACIGLRLGKLETKVGLITLLRKFKFTVNKKTPFPIEMDKRGFISTIQGDLWVDAVRV
uniref:Cytochrome P450 CYP6BW5v3 n=1 Tax=Dendroctonus valens TaxID=77173 RepID=M1NQH9_DENVA|nr:cytochrome P450 CYP6BW5v3 [Dendroctonus valens]